jgi:hypothetical protein
MTAQERRIFHKEKRMKKSKLYAAFVATVVFGVVQAPAQVTGSGTKGTVPVWVGTTKLGNSVIVQSAGNVGIGTSKPNAKLNVVSASKTAAAIYGNADATSGNVSGVFGVSASTTGFGVSGLQPRPPARPTESLAEAPALAATASVELTVRSADLA